MSRFHESDDGKMWQFTPMCPRWQRTWTMAELNDLCEGFGNVTGLGAQTTVRDFLEYVAERHGAQERFERQLERESGGAGTTQ